MRRPLGGGSVRISDLSRQTGVPTATIKFYLREHLLPPGAMTARNQADYGSGHLRRVWFGPGRVAPPPGWGFAPPHLARVGGCAPLLARRAPPGVAPAV